MKRILFIALTTLVLITLAACGKKDGASNSAPEASSSKASIIGTWAAQEPSSVNQQGMTITFTDLKSTYSKDHTATSNAVMFMSGPGLPGELKMNLSTSSTWSIEGDKLTEKVNNADIKMVSSIPGLPDLGGIMAQQMKSQPAGTSTIVKLDKKTLTLKENASGLIITMTRQ